MSFKNGEGVGADIKTVSEMVRHTDGGVTQKIYHHVNAKAIREVHQEYTPLRKLSTTLLER